MLYGIKDDETTTIVAAADNIAELEAFFTVSSTDNQHFVGITQPGLVECLADDRFKNFRKPPYVVIHTDAAQQDAFIEQFDITLLKPNALISKHNAMVEKMATDPYAWDSNDNRTIGEILGLDKYDPWDHRSEEEKAADLERQKQYKEQADKEKAKGNLSGDSFSAPKDSDLSITDVRVTQNSDGTIDIDNILAVKGLHEDNDADRVALDAEMKARKQGLSVPENLVEDEPETDLSVNENGRPLLDPNDTEGSYFKFDVLMATLEDLIEAGLDKDPLYSNRTNAGNEGIGSWFAFKRRVQANMFRQAVKDAGFSVEDVYGCDAYGERLLPRNITGVQVVDAAEEAEIGPRPWNDRAVELLKMTDEEKAANWKTVTGKEFILCGEYEGPDLGCIVYIVPRQYWEKHRAMYPESLNINHILPQDMEEVKPGIYQSKSRDWNRLSYDLAQRKFAESYTLRIYLSNIN